MTDYNDDADEHVGHYAGEGMLDWWVCSCGWKGSPHFDGAHWAEEEWERHVAKTKGAKDD